MAKQYRDPVLTKPLPSTRIPLLVILGLIACLWLSHQYFFGHRGKLLGGPPPRNQYIEQMKAPKKTTPPVTPAPLPTPASTPAASTNTTAPPVVEPGVAVPATEVPTGSASRPQEPSGGKPAKRVTTDRPAHGAETAPASSTSQGAPPARE